MRTVIAVAVIVGLLLASGAASGTRPCLRGTVYSGVDRVSGARLKLSAERIEVSTFVRDDGTYTVCVEEGHYVLEVFWGRDVYTDSDFVVRGDEVRDVQLNHLRKK